MFHRLISVSFVLMAAAIAHAEDAATSGSPLETTGYFDMYYQNADSGQFRSAGRAFDARNSVMQLNLAEISFKKKVSEVQLRADLAFGEMLEPLMGIDPTAAVSTANADATKYLPQAFLTYNPANAQNLSITAGKFYSYLGFEVTHAKDNWQYSRSYTYNYGIPFWHEGVGAAYAVIPGKFTSTLYMLNAWDGRIANEQNKSSTWGASLNYVPVDGASLIYNVISGSETTNKDGVRTVHELIGSYQINAFAAVAFDVIQGQQDFAVGTTKGKWSGYSLYAKYAFTSWYTLSPRYEVFDDSDAGVALATPAYTPAAIGIKQKITSITLSNNFNLGNGLETRLELRQDKSDVTSAYFKNKDGLNSDKEMTTTLALLYGF